MAARRSTPLTRDEILETALRIIDADGTEGLSMRKLARELGVEAMSLYHHVPSKQALLDGVVELSLAAQAPANVSGMEWQDTVVAAVCAFRRALVAHPNVLPVMASHPPASPEASRMYIEGPLGFLVANGMAEREASQLFEAVFALSFGHAMLATNYPAIEPAGLPTVDFTEESFERTVRVLIDGYSEDAANGSQAVVVDVAEVRQALRLKLIARGYAVASDTMGARGGLYIMGPNDVARALFEFRSNADDAVYEAAHQGSWSANMPLRFAVLPGKAAPLASLATLEQMRATPLLFDVVEGVVVFRDLDRLLEERLGAAE